MKKNNFITFGAPAIESPEIKEVISTLKSGWLGTGPKVVRFEEAIRRYKQASWTVAVNSCTAALHLSLLAAGVKPGDEVITTSLTFCATVNAIIHAGATPVLADIDFRTMNIDPSGVEKKMTPRTKALLLVHFAGRPCEMKTLMELARRHRLKVVEDCAHALETEYDGRKAGTFGDFGCLSFYVTKSVVTGEGGMVIAKRKKDAARIKMLALHGMTADAWRRFDDEGFKHYYVVECGFKYNMTDLQASMGLHQLTRVETAWKRRRSIWKQYQEAFSSLPLVLPAPEEKNTKHGYHLFTVLIDEKKTGVSRDQFLKEMTRRSIGVGVHYLSIPEHPYYRKKFGWKPVNYPFAMRTGQQTVSLPLSAKLTDDQVGRIIETVKEILQTA